GFERPMTRCAPSFAHFAKGGNHERMGTGVCPRRVASATLPPILTTNARMGHPQLERPRQIQELCVPRCYFSEGSAVQGGFYFTLYVSGYGNDEARALQNWGVGLKLVGSAVVQFI